jgi:hypothetical protein
MITKDNIKELIQTIEPAYIDAAINGDGDFILLQSHITNVGASGTIESIDYNEEIEEDAAANGHLFVDKDEFLRLAEELEIFEY